MSVNIPNHYAKQYATNIQLLLQQMGSRLRDKVTVGNYKGEQASPVDQIGAVEMQSVTTRFAPMGRVDADTARRWVYPASYDLPQLIDNFDLLRTLTDPKSKYVQNAVNAAGRRIDRSIISAFFGTAQTGKEGATATSFATSTNSIAVNFGATGDVGLSVAKIREAKRILMAADVDVETDPCYIAVTAKQHDDLLAEAQVISLDYNDKPVLMEGKIKRFLGFDFVHTELVGESLSSGDVQVPVWCKSGMHLGLWADERTDISQRKDLQGLPWQVYTYLTMGATRLDEEKVVRILCNI